MLAAVVLAFLLGLGSGARRERLRHEAEILSARADTVVVVDTVTVREPVAKLVVVRDTAWVPFPDTVLLRTSDTVLVPVPIETKLYEDPQYRAWVSGYRASLDSISVFPKTVTIDRKIPVYRTKRWGVGLQAGVTWTKADGVTPYAGIGVSYDLLSF